MEESKISSPVVDRQTTPAEAPPLDRWETPPARLYRSRSDRIVGGVCGGLGHYFNLDPVLIRLAFVLFALSGAGVLAYLILWIVIPERPLTEPEPAITATMGRGHGKEIVAWALVAFGLLLLATNLHLIPSWDWNLVWPALLIVVGAALLLRRSGPSA